MYSDEIGEPINLIRKKFLNIVDGLIDDEVYDGEVL